MHREPPHLPCLISDSAVTVFPSCLCRSLSQMSFVHNCLLAEEMTLHTSVPYILCYLACAIQHPVAQFHTHHTRAILNPASDWSLSRPSSAPLLDSQLTKGTVLPPDSAMPRRVGGLRYKWYCHLCPQHNWHVQICPHSFPFAPQPSDFFFPFVLRQICFNVTSAYERKNGKTSVILPHAVHALTAVLVAIDALSFYRFTAENFTGLVGRAPVWCRVAHLLCIPLKVRRRSRRSKGLHQ